LASTRPITAASPTPRLALHQHQQHSANRSTAPPTSTRACRRRGVARASSASPATTTTPSTSTYGVVVTGGSKGIGRALALEFLRSGDRVVICSRDAQQVQQAAEELERESGLPPNSNRVFGLAADVSKAADVRSLAAFAREKLGQNVDLWINNAGTNAYKYGPLLESDDETLERIVETNVLGVLLCCREAVRLMKEQPSGGHIFNMDGAGADGNATPRFAAYGATKRSLAQLGASLRAELKLAGIKGVGVHDLSPGMVATDLLLSGARDTKAARFFVNALAEEAKDVAAFLVPRVRAVPEGAQRVVVGSGGSSSESSGDEASATTPANFLAAAANSAGGGVPQPVYIRFLTKPKAFGQILTRLLTGARKGRFVEEE
jgi:chlorophyll(ide) b reductase